MNWIECSKRCRFGMAGCICMWKRCRFHKQCLFWWPKPPSAAVMSKMRTFRSRLPKFYHMFASTYLHEVENCCVKSLNRQRAHSMSKAHNKVQCTFKLRMFIKKSHGLDLMKWWKVRLTCIYSTEIVFSLGISLTLERIIMCRELFNCCQKHSTVADQTMNSWIFVIFIHVHLFCFFNIFFGYWSNWDNAIEWTDTHNKSPPCPNKIEQILIFIIIAINIFCLSQLSIRVLFFVCCAHCPSFLFPVFIFIHVFFC